MLIITVRHKTFNKAEYKKSKCCFVIGCAVCSYTGSEKKWNSIKSVYEMHSGLAVSAALEWTGLLLIQIAPIVNLSNQNSWPQSWINTHWCKEVKKKKKRGSSIKIFQIHLHFTPFSSLLSALCGLSAKQEWALFCSSDPTIISHEGMERTLSQCVHPRSSSSQAENERKQD